MVEGRLQIRSYDDSNGVRRRAAEIHASRVVFLPNGRKSDSPGGVEAPPWPDEEPGAKTAASFGGEEIPVNPDEIPF